MIEDIILLNDKKGISKLRKCLPKNFCEKTAKYIARNSKRTIIITGFYIKGTCETDGLSGAIQLAKSLDSCGSKVFFVTDKYCAPILKRLTNFPVTNFPIQNNSANFVEKIIDKINPTLAIAIERCGKAKNNRYYNYKGIDITKYTARIDDLIKKIPSSVAVGDTGNEIGMGSFSKEIIKEKIFPKPSPTETKHLVVSSTSDWGCYGIIAYLSRIFKKDFLDRINHKTVAYLLKKYDALDGISGKNSMTVDTYSLQETKEIIQKLKACNSKLSKDW